MTGPPPPESRRRRPAQRRALSSRPRAVVVGGGIAGLAAATGLAERGVSVEARRTRALPRRAGREAGPNITRRPRSR